jgi:beta-alanine degradation protein BauB
MRFAAAVLLLLCAAAFGPNAFGQMSAQKAPQKSVPVSEDQVPQRKQLLQNARVTVSLLDLAPGEATPMHQHDHDMLSIVITPGQVRSTVFGQRAHSDKIDAGEVNFYNAGYSHALRNQGTAFFRAVDIKFAEPQGKVEKTRMSLLKKSTRTCNPGTNVCVDEKYLFCTARVCVEDVTMAPGAVSTTHTHTTDHMLVAVSDFELRDEIEGKAPATRTMKSGEVGYIPAGITHKLTNTGKEAARFVVVLWR